MEIIANNIDIKNKVIEDAEILQPATSSFIEANTDKVSLQHLKEECIIPVFSKDNESTISHFEFIERTFEVVKKLFPDVRVKEPDIRASHIVKGRIPSA